MTKQLVGSRASVWCAGAVLMAAAAAPAAAQQRDPIEQGLAVAMKHAVLAAASTDAAAPAPQDKPADPPADKPADNPVLKFFANTELSGFVDTYYLYNFNKPSAPAYTLGDVKVDNALRAFDVTHNSFSLSLAEIAFEKKPAADSRAGFRVDLDYGSTANLVAAFDPGGTTVYQNIQQAYLSYLADVGSGLQVDVGKFVTPAGFEVIEAKDNWNYSRGLLFTWAIPLYHVGVRAAYTVNDKVSVTGFLFNGWNNAVDNNTGKSLGISAAIKVTPKLSLSENYIFGPELTGTNDHLRQLSDTVLTFPLTGKLNFALNYDYGSENGLSWQGVALYGKYQANDMFSITPRYEFFNDKDGWALIGQNVQEFTLTGETKFKDGVVMRLEYRGDWGDTPPLWLNGSGEPKKSQNTISVSWIYAFSTKAP